MNHNSAEHKTGEDGEKASNTYKRKDKLTSDIDSNLSDHTNANLSNLPSIYFDPSCRRF